MYRVDGITCFEIIIFAASGPSSSVQTGAPSFENDSKAESVGAKTVKVLGPAMIISVLATINNFNFHSHFTIAIILPQTVTIFLSFC